METLVMIHRSLSAEAMWLGGLALGLVLCLLIRRSKPPPGDWLDTPLVRWTRDDPFTLRQFLASIAVFGRTGSGKSSSSGWVLASAIVSLPKRTGIATGGLVIGAKPEDRAFWERIFERAGRSDDLLLFGPDEPGGLQFNFLDYIRRTDGQTRSIVQFLLTVSENLHPNDAKGGGDRDPFWKNQEERLLYNAVEIVQQGLGRVTAPDLQRFIAGAAQTPEQISDPAWRNGFHCQTLEAPHAAAKNARQAADFELALEFWAAEFPTMADKTRSSVLAGVMSLLHALNTSHVRELVSQETTVSPDDILIRGKWVLVNMSPAVWGASGSVICAGWKALTQKAVLRREAKQGDPICCVWSDEAPQTVNSGDGSYLAQCRSHLGCMVFLGQSVSGYHAALGEHSEHAAMALLSQFGTTIVHAADPETAEWASKKLGRRKESFFGGSQSPPQDAYDEVFGQMRMTGSFNEHYENVIQEREFINGLSTGGPAAGFRCDAIVIRSGEPFASCHENWLKIAFPQEQPCKTRK